MRAWLLALKSFCRTLQGELATLRLWCSHLLIKTLMRQVWFQIHSAVGVQP